MKTPDKVVFLTDQVRKLKGQIALLLAKIKLYLYLSHLEFNHRFIDHWIEDATTDVEQTLEQIKQGGITKIQEQKILHLLKTLHRVAQQTNLISKR